MFIPLANYTHYSLQKAYSKIDELVEKANDYKYTALALTDYNMMSGCIPFEEICRKKKIKPIFGVTLHFKEIANNTVLLAKNKNGYKQLVQLVSLSHKNDEVSFSDLKDTSDIVFISINKVDENDYPATIQVYNGQQVGFPTSLLHSKENIVPLSNTHYVDSSDRLDYLTLVCSSEGIKFNELAGTSLDSSSLFKVFERPDSIESLFSQEQIELTTRIANECEDFSIIEALKLPKFNTPNNLSQEDFLRELCREGWRKKIAGKIDESLIPKYIDRVKYELDVILRAGLSGYFNVVQDYVNWAKKRMLCGSGRGSSAGCLISYLTNITEIDPLVYDLLFERFYNEGRNTSGKVACPDIDTDFPPDRREDVINYIRELYGADYVCQVATFSRLQGRGALKEVFRIHNICDDKTANEITKHIPQEAEISDKLAEEKEVSIIRWTLRNEPKGLSDWCVLTKVADGIEEYTGPFAEAFKQAIRIEGTFKSYGKHASALIISNIPIAENYPMVLDKSGNEMLLGVEYEFAEMSGLPKFDILGVNALKKLMNVENLLKYGKLRP